MMAYGKCTKQAQKGKNKMGFCTTINPYTGREVLTCDFCGGYPARKIRCPFGYCQEWATCAGCRKAGKHKVNSAGQYGADGVALPHSDYCKAASQEFEQRKAEREQNAERVVAAAWGEWLTGMPNTCLIVTVSGDYYLAPTDHYKKRNTAANTFIDEQYRPIATPQAKALLAVEYGDTYGAPTTKELVLN